MSLYRFFSHIKAITCEHNNEKLGVLKTTLMTTNTIQLKHHSLNSMSSRGSYALYRKDNTITTIQ